MVGSHTRMPIRRSSSRMRRWPQGGFSRLSVTMSSTMVSSTGGRSPLSVRRRSDLNRVAQRIIVVRGDKEVALEGLIAARKQVREHLRRPDPEGDALSCGFHSDEMSLERLDLGLEGDVLSIEAHRLRHHHVAR